jgi:hypothetical protein
VLGSSGLRTGIGQAGVLWRRVFEVGWRALFRVANSMGSCDCTSFTGLIFDDSGRFRPVSVNFGHFRPPFFLFLSFSDFGTRYTRK